MATGLFEGALAGELINRIGRIVDGLEHYRRLIKHWGETFEKLETVLKIHKENIVKQRDACRELELEGLGLSVWNGECSLAVQKLTELLAEVEHWIYYGAVFAAKETPSWRSPKKLYARYKCASQLEAVYKELNAFVPTAIFSQAVDHAIVVRDIARRAEELAEGRQQDLRLHLEQTRVAAQLQRTLSSGSDKKAVQRSIFQLLVSPIQHLAATFQSIVEQRPQQASTSGSPAPAADSSVTLSEAPRLEGKLFDLDKKVADVVALLTSDGRQLVGIAGKKKWDLNKKNEVESFTSVTGLTEVGLHGMGGIGKTTLAVKVFESAGVRSHFTGGKYWLTISQTLNEQGTLEALWRQVFGSIAGFPTERDEDFPVTPGGPEGQRAEICRRARVRLGLKMRKKEKVLLVLDDVWRQEHARNFHEIVNNAVGCKVLVTTRDMELLDSLHWSRYALDLLSDEDSLKLFCLQAFGSETPSIDVNIRDFAKQACDECKGLPLALSVIGASFQGVSDPDEWEQRLTTMKECEATDDKVQTQLYHRLDTSVEALPYEILKELFVDFAGFPEDYNISIRGLIDSWGADPRVGGRDRATIFLSVLLSRSLVEFSEEPARRATSYEASLGFCRVHDVIRDLAVQRAKKQGDEAHRKQLFMTVDDDFRPDPKGYAAVKMVIRSDKDMLPSQVFGAKATNLQLFEYHGNLRDEFNCLPSSSSDDAQIACAALSLPCICCIGVKSFLKFPKEFAKCSRLRVLDIHQAYGLSRSPALVGVSHNLRVLRVTEDDEGFLSILEKHYLGGASRLEVLEVRSDPGNRPPSMPFMPRLRVLSLYFARCTWVSNVRSCPGLEELYLDELHKADESSLTPLTHLTSLRTLHLSDCYQLDALPDLGSLRLLKHVVLHELPLRAFPLFLGKIPGLETLRFSKCKKLAISGWGERGAFAALTEFQLTSCNLSSLPPFEQGTFASICNLVLTDNATSPLPLPPSITGRHGLSITY